MRYSRIRSSSLSCCVARPRDDRRDGACAKVRKRPDFGIVTPVKTELYSRRNRMADLWRYIKWARCGMHCPKCGFASESDEVSFCSRCGQELGAVRFAFKGSEDEGEIGVRQSGVTFGVVMMALLVAVSAVVLVADQIRNPLAFALVIAMMGYLGI